MGVTTQKSVVVVYDGTDMVIDFKTYDNLFANDLFETIVSLFRMKQFYFLKGF